VKWAYQVIAEHPGAWDEMMVKREYRMAGKWKCSTKQLHNARATNLKCRHHIRAMRTLVKFGLGKVSDLVPIPYHPGKRRRKGESRFQYGERLGDERRAREKAEKKAADVAAAKVAKQNLQPIGDVEPAPIIYPGNVITWCPDPPASQYDDDRFGYKGAHLK
jgi:hypothetical protein